MANVKPTINSYDLGAVSLIIFVVVVGFFVAAGVNWPVEVDLYRDLGAVHSILSGNLGGDPSYSGELWWYNPLVPTMVAELCRLTGLSPEVIYTRGGVFLNAGAPIAFYLLVRTLATPQQALAALVLYLFWGNSGEPPWLYASYSPWLWPLVFVQALFYLGCVVALKAFKAKSGGWFVVLGFFLGVVFLGHTAPALILGLVSALLILWWCVEERGVRRAIPISRGILLVLCAGCVAMAFIGPLLFHYGLQILHPAPTRFVAISGGSVVEALFSVRGVLGLVGFVAIGFNLIGGGIEPLGRRLLLGWGGASLILLIYGLVAQSLEVRGVFIPMIVPSFHFLLYLQGVLALTGGLLVGSLGFRSKGALVTVVVGLVLCSLPWYFKRYDRTTSVEFSRSIDSRTDHLKLREWVLKNVAPSETVLAAPDTALYFVASTGRKVVVLPTYFSSPYVDYERRVEDLYQMYGALREGDSNALQQMATTYRVDYVVVDLLESDPCCQIGREVGDLPVAFTSGSLRVYRVGKPSA